jgi:hypothetical protein
MQRDAEQSALGKGIHRKIEHRCLHHAVDDAFNFSGGFLEHQNVIGAEKCHARGHVQPRDDGADI